MRVRAVWKTGFCLTVGNGICDSLQQSLPGKVDGTFHFAREITARDVKLSFGGSVYGPTDPMGRLVFDMMRGLAGCEADLIRQGTRAGMKITEGRAAEWKAA